MPKKSTKTAVAKITAVKKGEIYENKHKDLVEITNGRLKDEGDLGMSFEGRTITFDAKTKTALRDKDAERFYLDELVRKLTAAEYNEWIDAGSREAEAAEAATGSTPKGKGKKEPADKPGKTKPSRKSDGKLSAVDAAARVLTEAGEPMTTKAMIEAMATKGYWTSPGGKTPAATLYSAILREINTKEGKSRFEKKDRGLFAAK